MVHTVTPGVRLSETRALRCLSYETRPRFDFGISFSVAILARATKPCAGIDVCEGAELLSCPRPCLSGGPGKEVRGRGDPGGLSENRRK